MTDVKSSKKVKREAIPSVQIPKLPNSLTSKAQKSTPRPKAVKPRSKLVKNKSGSLSFKMREVECLAPVEYGLGDAFMVVTSVQGNRIMGAVVDEIQDTRKAITPANRLLDVSLTLLKQWKGLDKVRNLSKVVITVYSKQLAKVADSSVESDVSYIFTLPSDLIVR